MRAMTSPLRTSAPSCSSTHVSTPSRSDFVVARSRTRRASVTSLPAELRSRLSPWSSTSVVRSAFFRWASSWASSACAWLTASSDWRSASRDSSCSANSALLPCSLASAPCSSRRFTSMRPSRSTSDFSSPSRVWACLFSLTFELVHELVEAEDRLADIELHDRIAGLDRGAGAGQDPQHARVERARQDALDLGHDRSRGGEARFDGAGGDDRRPHARSAHRRTHPARQPDQHRGNHDEGDDDAGRLLEAIQALNVFGQGAIHHAAPPLIHQAPCRSQTIESGTYGRPDRPDVQERTNRCPELNADGE